MSTSRHPPAIYKLEEILEEEVLMMDLFDVFPDAKYIKEVDYKEGGHWNYYVCDCQQEKISFKYPSRKISETILETVEIEPVSEFISAGMCGNCEIIYYIEFE